MGVLQLGLSDGTYRSIGCGDTPGRLYLGLSDGSYVREKCAADGPDLLNPGAEDGTERWQPTGIDDTLTTGTPARTGSAAFVVGTSNPAGTGFGFRSMQGPVALTDGGRAFHVPPSTAFTFTAWVRTSGWTGVASLMIDWWLSGGSAFTGFGDDVAVSGGGWTEVTFTGTTPAGASHARLRMRGSTFPDALPSGAVAYVDDLAFEPILAPVARPVLLGRPDGTYEQVACMVPA